MTQQCMAWHASAKHSPTMRWPQSHGCQMDDNANSPLWVTRLLWSLSLYLNDVTVIERALWQICTVIMEKLHTAHKEVNKLLKECDTCKPLLWLMKQLLWYCKNWKKFHTWRYNKEKLFVRNFHHLFWPRHSSLTSIECHRDVVPKKDHWETLH